MKTIFALLIVAAIVATTTFGVARSLRSRPLELHDTAWLRHELKLTDAQAAEAAKLEADFQKRLADSCAAHCAARADLAESLNDPTKAAEACQRMCGAQNDSEKAALDHILRVRALLTPEQQKRHAALIQQQEVTNRSPFTPHPVTLRCRVCCFLVAITDMMKRVAAPMVGGLATSFIMKLLVYPAIYLLWKWHKEVKPQTCLPEAVSRLRLL